MLAAVLFAGYMLWLRDSSLVAVEEVEVKGVTANSEEVTASIASAAEGMTTLHTDLDALREAVSGYPTVASIAVDASPPHKLTVTVTERLPVAVAEVGGREVPVSGDGLALEGVRTEGRKLPTLEASRVRAGHVDAEAAAQAAILAAAPTPIRDRLRSASFDPALGGVVVGLEGAPELRFGDAERAEAKWEAASAVLADPDLTASYVDVSVPERSVAG